MGQLGAIAGTWLGLGQNRGVKIVVQSRDMTRRRRRVISVVDGMFRVRYGQCMILDGGRT